MTLMSFPAQTASCHFERSFLLSFRAEPVGRSREICHSSGAFLRFLVEQILFKALNGKALRPLSPEMRLVL